jgi:carbamoyl-phosphate synthase small subunit
MSWGLPRSPGSTIATVARSRSVAPPTSASSTRPPPGRSSPGSNNPWPAAARNTAFEGETLRGRVRHTISRGEPWSSTGRRNDDLLSELHTARLLLVLADGAVFEGEAIGAAPPGGVATGEVVFNTVLTGYQEVITDPSYAGQIITFTYPHIGNYGVTPPTTRAAGRSAGRGRPRPGPPPLSWRSDRRPRRLPARHGVPGIAGIDTRRLTRHIRDAGPCPGAFGTADHGDAAAAAARAEPGTDGVDLVARSPATPPTPWPPATGAPRVVAYDFGIKRTILRHLGRASPPSRWCRPRPRPTRSWPAEPDGVFLSNGPGDPAAVPYATAPSPSCWAGAGVRHLPRPPAARHGAIGARPTSCRSATTAATTRCATSPPAVIEITSQNHNFASTPRARRRPT